MTTPTNAPPVFKDQIGKVEAAIWLNQSSNGRYLTASFARRRKDQNGKWTTSHSFASSDLPNLRALIESTFAELRKREAELDTESDSNADEAQAA